MENKNIKTLKTVTKTGQEKQSQATRIRTLFNKYNKWFKQQYNITPFKEPVMFFIRRSGEIEFYEKVTKGLFEYKHSGGDTRFIIVNPTTQYKLGFANKKFRGYIAHEDHPITGWPDPYITAEQVNIIVEKSLNDMKKWKAEVLRETQGIIKWIAITVIGIILAYVLFRLLIDEPTSALPAAQTVKDSVVTIIQQNTTVLP